MTFTRQVLDKGYVELTNIAGPVRRLDAQFDGDVIDIARAARVSYGQEAASRPREKDVKLVKRLHKDNHTSPFEMVMVWFNIKLPILVQRQWSRHRTWRYTHVNEISRRYTAEKPEFYMVDPDKWRKQSTTNKQGSEGCLTEGETCVVNFAQRENIDVFSKMYTILLDNGIARELARKDMPVSTYTRMSVCMDLLTLRHFLELRRAKDAQYEIREYAEVMHSLLVEHLPGYVEVFGDKEEADVH